MLVASKTLWLVLGTAVGYALMMRTNPVRECLRDGWLAVRRYPVLWILLGSLGFAHAIFSLATRAYLAAVLPMEERPIFVWMRESWRDPKLWLAGSPGSVWWLPRGEFLEGIRASLGLAVESTAGLFDCPSTTFPLAALAAPLLLLAWRGRGRVFLDALRRRFGNLGFAIYAGLTLSACCALLKAVWYFLPRLVSPLVWMHWGQAVASAAFPFEYLSGIGAQVFLLLVAYAWVRGLNFSQGDMVDVAIRRFACVLQWSSVVLLLSLVLIELPLTLKNFPSFASIFVEAALLGRWLEVARAVILLVILAGAGMQVSLALHTASLRRAWTQHGAMCRAAWWPLLWFAVIAGFHFLLLRAVHENLERGFGEGTALWVACRLIAPWTFGLLGAWLLASWVCFYQRFARGETLPDHLTEAA